MKSKIIGIKERVNNFNPNRLGFILADLDEDGENIIKIPFFQEIVCNENIGKYYTSYYLKNNLVQEVVNS